MTPTTVSHSTAYFDLRAWLVQRRNDGATPDVISRELLARGWDADTAASTALTSLRAADRRRLLYIGLCWGAGLAALGAGSAAHLALTDSGDPLMLAFFITLLIVAAPIAVLCHLLARKAEAEDEFVIWSPTRRTLFATLATCTGAVGIARLLRYTFDAVAAAVGAYGYEFTPTSVVQVLVTLVISVPLFWWSLVEWKRSNIARQRLATSAEDKAGTVTG